MQEPEMAGLHRGHLTHLQTAAPQIHDISEQLYRALTNNLNPHLPALPALMAMIEMLQEKDFGVLSPHRLVRLPLSIIGTDQVRYRSPVVSWLHETILSMRMSEITIEEIRNILRPHGICLLFLCSCGVVMGRCEDVRRYYGSDAHRRMDRLRSAIDAAGNPVEHVRSLEEIPTTTMDLHCNGAEARLFSRIEALIKSAAPAGSSDYSWIDDELDHFVKSANSERSLIAA